MNFNLSYSSELMSNYMQAETVGPGQKFEALQTNNGHSLLFSIGTYNVFYLTEELVGEKTGWQQHDISSPLITNLSSESTIIVKTFSVGQNNNTGIISILLVLTIDDNDHLYTASYTQNEEGPTNLTWSELPFDAIDNAPSDNLNISNVDFMQTAKSPLAVVDLQSASNNDIYRYYIDITKHKSDYYWNLYDLPIDVDASQPIQICGGRKEGGHVDGLYTMGQQVKSTAIVFQELYDYYDPSSNAPVNSLNLPSGVIANAIASTPSSIVPSTDSVTYTDLYVSTTEGDLYFFGADNQRNGSIGVKLFTNDLFKEVNTLYAYTTETKVVVWGLNRAQQVFYTQAPVEQISNSANWSYPLPIANNVVQISPYINRINGGNTYFAHIGTNSLKKVFQDPVSTCWQKQDILLPTSPNATAQKFDSYTTQIKVVDPFNNPIVNADIQISSSYRIPVYINYHYYILDTTPITIQTDGQGSIQIVQRIDSMQGACLQIQSNETTGILSINPMNNAAGTISTLTTTDSLSAAVVTDDKGNNPQPLVPSDTSQDDLNAAAASIQSLSDAYDSFLPQDSSATSVAFVARPAPTLQLGVVSSIGDTMSDFADAVVVAAGDVFSFLENAVDYVIEIIEDTAQEVWNFVCTIGGQVLTFVIDTVEKVVGAIEAIFQAIKTLVKDLIQFVKFLFSWGDIQLTKDVFMNMSQILMQESLDASDALKKDINAIFQSLENKISDWANIDDGTEPSSNSQTTLNDMTSAQNTSDMTSAPGAFLQYHFTNNAANASYLNEPTQSLVETLLDDISNALKAEKDVIKTALDEFMTNVIEDDQYKTMSLLDLLKTTVGILAKALLTTAQNIIDLLFDIVNDVASSVMTFICQPIWIPVVSDILDEFFDTTIPFSWLDIIMLVGAIPATLGYKIIKQKAPFSDSDDYTNELLAAKSMADLILIIKGTAPKSNTLALAATTTGQTPIQETIFIIGRLLTTVTSAISAVLVIPSNVDGLSSLSPITIANTINNLVGVALNILVNVFAQPVPIKNEFTNTLYYSITIVLIIEKLIFSMCVIGYKKDDALVKLAKDCDQIASLIIKVALGITTVEHLVELILNYSDSPIQSNLAFAQCGSDFCGITNSALETAFIFPLTPSIKTGVEVVDMGIYGINGVLQITQSIYAAIES